MNIDAATIKSFINEFERASATKDFDQVAPMIHPEALFGFNDGDFQGIDQVRAAFESTWSLDIKDDQYSLSDLEVRNIDNQSATVTFNYHWSGITAKGPMNMNGRGTQVIVMHEGCLKILLEHLSR